MSDRRTCLHKARDHPAIPEEDSFTEKKSDKVVLPKSKDATVEVTVKVKRRRDKCDAGKRLIPIPEKGFRKGSWGDLLTSSRTSLVGKEDEAKKDVNVNRQVTPTKGDCKHTRKTCINGNHSPLCQKIPITDDLYLETHTHVRKVRSEDKIKASTKTTADGTKRTALVKENEELREEVDRLKKEIESSKNRSRAVKYISKATLTMPKEHAAVSEQKSEKSRAFTQGTQTSTMRMNLNTSPKKKSGVCQTDEGFNRPSPPRKLVQAQVSSVTTDTTDSSHLENLRLERENEALRREASDLLTQVNKARADYLECCNTIKELYQIAANLKHENTNLTQSQQQQQSLQNKLLQTLAENKDFFNTYKSNQVVQDEQLVQIRNVIKDVKKTIAQEMEGLQLNQISAFPIIAEKDGGGDGDMNAGFTGENSFLNDTNASEIQHIFSARPPEMRRGMVQEDRSSSTQYLTLAGLSSVESHYRPSPCADTNFSPRISTPNSSQLSSVSLSEVAMGANSFRPIQQATSNCEKPSADDTNDEWKKLEAELARSFTSVRNELSYQSTTSYSDSSTSSPNPIRKY